jgi:hypothetical protein
MTNRGNFRLEPWLKQLGLFGALLFLLAGCGPLGEEGEEDTVKNVNEALTTCTTVTALHLTNGGVAATPFGELMTPETTFKSGFSPTHVITTSGFIWYTDPLTGSFPAGTFTLDAWTNHPGGRSPIFAQLGVSAADGSGFSPLLVSPTIDVNTTGTGNHITALAIPISNTVQLAAQRLVVKVFLDATSGNTAPTMVYNAGTDFDSLLRTPSACVRPTLNAATTLHLTGTSEPDVTPTGRHLRRTSTAASGFFPTTSLTSTPLYWYSETVSLALPASTASFALWTNSPGAPSTVRVRLERTAADGSGAILLAESSKDVNASGTGNHMTTYGPFSLPAITTSTQRLRVSLTRTSGAAVTAVFNAGTDFDSRLALTPNVANVAPIAAAGPDQTAIVGKMVTLDGTASRDADNGPQPLGYLWTRTSGPAVTLSGATTARPTFTPSATGTYAFRLQVSDGATTATDDVLVTVVDNAGLPGPFAFTRQVYAAPNLDYGYLAQPPITYDAGFGVTRVAQGDYREYHLFPSGPFASRTIDLSVFQCGGQTEFPPISSAATNVPLNGIFYLPTGTGTFPIAFFLHGTHQPRERSEPGYEEAARHLASHGVLAVTVDENYANGGCGNGGRAVWLLEHVKQFRTWNATLGHPLAGKIDMSRVMIIGHSRGGEAVEVASFFNRLTNQGVTSIRPFPDTPEFEGVNAPVSVNGGHFGPWQFSLQAVVAIAPVEGEYMPVDPANDTRQIETVVEDNFFIIHGNRDSDVGRFVGHAAYDRAVPFDPHAATDTLASIKGLLFIANANHNYFNRIWQLHPDGTTPGSRGVVYDANLQLSADDQYASLKTWLVAIAQPTLLGRPETLDVLREKALLALVLPSAVHTDSGGALTLGFQSQFQDRFRLLVDHYEEDTVPTTTSPLPAGITGGNEALALTIQELLFTMDPRPFFTEQTHGLNALWGSSGARTYRVFFSSGPPLVTSSGQPLTDVALRIGFTPEETQNPVNVNQDFTLEVRDRAGATYALAATTLFGSVPVLPYPNDLTESERAFRPFQVVMQTVRFPLARFAERGVAVQNVSDIRVRFDRTASGSAYVDDLQLTR